MIVEVVINTVLTTVCIGLMIQGDEAVVDIVAVDIGIGADAAGGAVTIGIVGEADDLAGVWAIVAGELIGVITSTSVVVDGDLWCSAIDSDGFVPAVICFIVDVASNFDFSS